jgi:hypothetical protein
VMPLRRRAEDPGLAELTSYLVWLARRVEVIVADGSEPDVYARHHQLWKGFALHVAVVREAGVNGKAAGVRAGVDAAGHEHVVIADDDVRYDDGALEAVAAALGCADLVRPQNFFHPLPWHAAWDTSRTLLNRCFGSDSPGTLSVRRSFFLAMGGYDDTVLYENLELVRTVMAADGRVAERPDLYVRRLPSTARRFFEQRPRQAYDDFAQPVKLAGFLLGVPALILTRRLNGVAALTGAALATVALAERGRRRHGGKRVFPSRASWWAPVWVLERSVCAWLAAAYRVSGGVPYAGSHFRVAAHPLTELRRRARTQAMTAVTQRSGARPAAAT